MQNHFENAHSLTVAKEIAILLAFEGIQVAKLIKPFFRRIFKDNSFIPMQNLQCVFVLTNIYMIRSKKTNNKKIRYAIYCVHVVSLLVFVHISFFSVKECG